MRNGLVLPRLRARASSNPGPRDSSRGNSCRCPSDGGKSPGRRRRPRPTPAAAELGQPGPGAQRSCWHLHRVTEQGCLITNYKEPARSVLSARISGRADPVD